MKIYKLIFISFLLCILTGCNEEFEHPVTWTHYVDFQNADIIYNTIIDEENVPSYDKDILSYYSFEDQSITHLTLFGGHSPIHPYYLDESTIMAFTKLGYYGWVHEGREQLFIFSKIHYLSCDKLIGSGYPHNGNIVYFGNYEINIISSTDCSIIKTILRQEDLSEIEGKINLWRGALSINEEFILTNLDLNLVRISLPEIKIYDYQREGSNPTLSPDQLKVAYLAPNGIHIMNIDGGNDELVVPYRGYYGDYRSSDYAVIPTANWSSDNRKIVYHKCILPAGSRTCDDSKDYSIFMYDLETKAETFLFLNGLNPSWGWGK